MSILDHFSGTPRPAQRYALEELENSWNSHDVFIIEAPTAAGKSALSTTIARWQGQGTILTPTNILVDQYNKDYPELASLKNKKLYPCKNKYNCKKPSPTCRDCVYHPERAKFLCSPLTLCNYYMFTAMKLHGGFKTRTVIIDEAHNVLNYLADMSEKHIWKHKDKYPSTLRTEADILDWLEESPKYKGSELVANMRGETPNYVFERTMDLYRGVSMECIKARPVSVRDAKPWLWPWFVRKIILLSATINHKDIEELGLDSKRVRYIKTDSPIPPSSRPVVYAPVGSFSSRNQDVTLPLAVERLKHILSQYQSKGVIHCTYSLARKLRSQLDDPRLIWHSRDNKTKQYQKFLDAKSESGAVLVACGLSEGIDLPKELGRWQVLLKVPYPSLVDTAVAYRARADQEWYSWETARAVLQACGRICRTPTDFGITIILDSAFEQLYKRNTHLFPRWFSEGLILDKRKKL